MKNRKAGILGPDDVALPELQLTDIPKETYAAWITEAREEEERKMREAREKAEKASKQHKLVRLN